MARKTPRSLPESEQKNIDYAIVANPHTPMYLMHKYWARKPYNVVSEYIKNYTKEGEVVLDPFCGSGVTPIEAIKLGRKAIGIDLNPVSTFITRNTAIPADTDQLKDAFEKIKSSCMKEINSFYTTNCKKCKQPSIVLAAIWDREKVHPIEMRYYCEKCKQRNSKKPQDEDIEILDKIGKMEVPFWFPTLRLAYNGEEFKEGTHLPDVDSVDKLFTKRNLISLSILFNRIGNIKNKKVREALRMAFTSMAHLASRMCPVAKPGGRGHWSKFSATSFWSQHRYYLPIISMESNVWMLFESAINGKQGVINGKKDSNAQIKKFKEASKFSELMDGSNIFLKTHNALELTKIIPKNSVDYVFTDPPYGGAVQYFELSSLWASWLDMELNYGEEITINNNQNKDFEYYHKMLRASFKEIYQVLKPGKILTVTFHSTDIRVWNSIIKAVAMVGFELEKIIYQPPARPSAKGLLQPYGSAVGDYYIRFKKPGKKVLTTEQEIDLNTYEWDVVGAAQKIIWERGEPTIYQHILNSIMAELQGGRRVPIGARNIEQVLRDRVGEKFELLDSPDEKGKVEKKWWLKGVDLSFFNRPSLSDRVERKIVEVLEHNVVVSFDEILQAIFMEFPNALTPETDRITDVLDEYATASKGRWILKPQFKMRESQHSEMIYYLAKLGKKTVLDVWVGQREQSEVFNKKRLSSLSDNEPRLWRFIDRNQEERVRQMDVLWHDSGKIRYTFEVENTTTITEAISRGSNIMGTNVFRIIVIPEEREDFLFRKLKDPLLKESVTKYNWKFIFYKDIMKFYENNKKEERINLRLFESLFRLPEEARNAQNSLDLGI